MAYMNTTVNPMNTFSNLSSTEGEIETTSSIFQYISYLVLTVLLTFGLIAHILAILATWRANRVKTEDNRHSLPSFLLTCLLRIDMVAVIFFFLRGFLVFIEPVKEHSLWCDFSVSTSIFFTWSSGLANCLMCAERSASLIVPFVHRRYATLKKAKISLIVVQLFALFICLLPLLGFGTYTVPIKEGDTYQYDCVSPGEPQGIEANKYHLYFSIIFFCVGFFIITCILVCNVIIVYFIFHLKNKISHLDISAVPAATGNAQDVTQHSSSSTKRKSSSETRFAMIMILVSIAYMISWLPLYIERFLAAFSVYQSEDSKRVGIWIHVFNYVITPVIFVFFKKRNRAGLRLVCVDYCCCCCQGYRRRVQAGINISQFGSGNRTIVCTAFSNESNHDTIRTRSLTTRSLPCPIQIITILRPQVVLTPRPPVVTENTVNRLHP